MQLNRKNKINSRLHNFVSTKLNINLLHSHISVLNYRIYETQQPIGIIVINSSQIEYKERERLAEELKSTRESMNTASQQATEAQTRLEVLGKYFQEREGELLK